MRLSPFALTDSYLSPAPDAQRVAWLRGVTYAHRGVHGNGRVENSPAAFAAAIERGLGIECDVQKSADNRAMVFHDWELDRLTGESGPVKLRGADELATVALSGSDDRIPTLTTVLRQVGGQVPLLIEIKSRRDVRHVPLCLAVRRSLEGYLGQVAVMSFDPRVVRWFARHAPLMVRGLVMTEENDRTLRAGLRRRMALWHAKPHFLAYDVRDLPSRFAAAQRRRGLPVLTWTVRDAELLERVRRHADAPIAEGAGLAAQPGE